MDNGKYVRVLRVLFDGELSNIEVTSFRGAVLQAMQQKGHLFYHNHISDDEFRYSYPLIQYKTMKGKACIVCVEEGADVIGQFLSTNSKLLKVGDRDFVADVKRIVPYRIFVQTWQHSYHYRIKHWLPLNNTNYAKFKQIESLSEKILFLENILKANLLSMCKGLDVHISETIDAKITWLSDSYILKNKGIKLMAFDANFTCNLSIPEYLGIGKHASIGYGVVTLDRKEKQ